MSIIRVRTPKACIRISATPTMTWSDLKTEVLRQLGDPQIQRDVLSFTADAQGKNQLESLDNIAVLANSELHHGSMIFCDLQDVQVPADILSAHGELRFGEIDFWSFACLLEDVQPMPGDVFCDIGAATGRAVVAASLLYPQLRKSFGIELQKSLWEICRGAMHKVRASAAHMGCAHADLRDEHCELHLPDGQVVANWSIYAASDIVYVASTAFSDALMAELSVRVRQAKRGARVITLTKPLVGYTGFFRLRFCRPYLFGWGSNATVYCWERL